MLRYKQMEVFRLLINSVIKHRRGLRAPTRVYEIKFITEEDGFSRAKRKEAKYYAY